jgi:hypothetical protein
MSYGGTDAETARCHPMSCRLAFLLLSLLALPSQGAEFTNSSQCKPGAKVTDRGGKSGSVTGVKNGMCVVKLDDGTERNYLHWMLSPAGATKGAPAAGLPPGNYACSAPGAGTFPIVIRDGGRYSDRAGKSGEFALQAGNEIVFRSGSLAGNYSRVLGAGKFGLSSAKGKSFYTVCNLK